MIEKVKMTMTEQGIMPSRSVLVALSGGADSVALLHIMHKLSGEYGFCVYAAHVNHGLRGDDATRDMEFARELCRSLGIECFIHCADVRAYADEWGVSEEMAGRRVRYEFFSQVMEKYNIEFCATAHHKNDNAETILMNLLRGSATAGLSGIPYRRDGFIRPLLGVTRAQIEEYCNANNLLFVIDATNLDTVYTRNKIRNILIPQLEREFNPSLVTTLTANAEIIRRDEEFLDTVAQAEYTRLVSDEGGSNGVSADVEKLTALHSAIALRVIRKMIDNVCGVSDVSGAVFDAVYSLSEKGQTGSVCHVAKGTVARLEYGRLFIGDMPEACPDFSYTVKIGESRFIPELGYTVSAEYADIRKGKGEFFSLPEGVSELTITNRRQGDRFVPWGMTGQKSLKSFMIDNKIPQAMRSRIGIMRVGGEIAWVIGYRRDNRFAFKEKGIKVQILY